MEYSLYTLNKKANLNNLTSEELINTLNLIGFEVDDISFEPVLLNNSLIDTKLLIKIPANRDDLTNEHFFLEEFGLLFLVQIYKIWEDFKKSYSWINQETYQNSLNVETNTIKTNSLDSLVYKIDVTVSKNNSPLWLKKKLAIHGIEDKDLIFDLLNLMFIEFGSTFGLAVQKSCESDLSVEVLQEPQSFLKDNQDLVLLPKNSIVLKDQFDNINAILFIPSVFLKKNNFVNLEDCRTNFSLTFLFDNSFEDKTLPDNNEFKKKLPLLRKIFRENIQLSFQRLLTLLEILGDAKILKVHHSDLQKFSSVPKKKLQLSKILLNKILNIDSHDPKIFEKAGLKIIEETSDYLYFEISARRRDLEREIDLIEEYSRFIGYKNFSEIIPTKNYLNNKREGNKNEVLQDYFLNYGFNEVFSNSIQEKKFQKNQIDITNPLNQDFCSLRTSIFPELFKIFEINLKLGASNLKFFEIGRVFKKVNEKIIEQDKVSGIFQSHFKTSPILVNQEDYNWLVTKGFFEIFLSYFGYSNTQIYFEKVSKHNSYFHPGKAVLVTIGDKILGTFGEINPKIKMNKFESSKLPIYAFDFNLTFFKDYMRKDNEIKNVKEYSKYPSIFRDLSFLIDKNENFTRLQKEIQKQAKYLINTVIFNVYNDETFAKNEINLVIRLEFQSLNETLTNEVVEKEIEKICGGLQEIYEIKFRN